MKFCLVSTCAVVTLVSALSLATERGLQEWDTFKTTHKKFYRDAAEESFRQRLFLETLQRVDEHNEKYKEGLVSYEKGINQFSDLTPEEIQELTAGFIMPEELQVADRTEYVIPEGYSAPDNVDWRDKGVVGRVKNQKGCGGCWAFSTIAALESHWAIKNGTFVYLSEQNLLDCVPEPGAHGCFGGWMKPAYEYVIGNDGIATEESYPYEEMNATCRYEPEMRGATVQNYVGIKKGDEEAMKAAVSDIGPLAIAFDANDNVMEYKGGIFYDPECRQDWSSHAAAIVGYGTENGQDYWLIKNSWSETWGEKGYLRLARNKNQCGIANWVVYPVV